MTAAELLRRVTEALTQAGIPHMLTGSFAASFHGAPRATQDVDLVIAPTPAQLDALAALLPDTDFYFPLEAAREALRQETMFNVIDLAGGWKVDCIVRRSRPFSRIEFERRQPADLLGMEIPVATLEDVIISKLEWAHRGGSRRQLDDVAELLRRRQHDVSDEYLSGWISALGLEPEWTTARQLAREH